MLAPLASQDDSYGWALLILCNAIGVPFELVEDWVRDTPDGPGWSLLLDAERCPPEALDWLAQFVGVRIPQGMSDDDARHRIESTDGFRRGTVAALQNAAWQTLTGKRSVFLSERDGDPADSPDYAYHLTVVTYASETPDPAATLSALLAQKPGGLVLQYVTAVGQLYSQVRDRFATYADLKAGYPNYQAVWTDTPDESKGGS